MNPHQLCIKFQDLIKFLSFTKFVNYKHLITIKPIYILGTCPILIS